MASSHPQCQALKLSDEQRCQDEATNANNLFCRLHAREAFGLYKGYKRRNAQLDSFDDEAPPYLKTSKVPLANDSFESLQDEGELQDVHSHLYAKYVLLGKVVQARRLHHKHFYPLQVDYGHQAYLDKLSSQRHTVLQALVAVQRRTAKVLYQKEKWFAWVREVQEGEDASREKEQRRVKQEAALFKRNMKNLQARLDRMRQKEEKKRQDAFLDDAYRERMSMLLDDESVGDEAWDPIEDLENDRRNRYIDLIKHFLWIDEFETDEVAPPPPSNDDVDAKPDEADAAEQQKPQTVTKKPKKKSKAKTKNGTLGATISGSVDTAYSNQERLLAMQARGHSGGSTPQQEPDKTNIETEEEMRKRLSEGVKKNFDDLVGIRLVGTLENPHETSHKTAPMADDEIESIVKDIREIKLLLFSRLVLAQAPLLPAALRASSVKEFLNDLEVTESDLRDLCLKVEEPTLQIIRDACADFARGDKAYEDIPDVTDDDDEEAWEDLINDHHEYSHLHTSEWLLERVLAKSVKPSRKKAKATAKAKSQSRKMKVKICGKSIWNHASEKAMSRDGWLQFSILAKDCSFEEAVQLCRNWSEFSDLNLLTLWQYFPASNWASWGGDRLYQQLQELGFFPYFIDLEAQQRSHRNQVGGRGQARRQHDIVESRNIVVGHMKRNDPVTRRFLQYLLMRAGELLVLVRDGKTGRVITAPPQDHLWTYRRKQGLGRAAKNDWVNELEVGPDYFDMTDELRKWRFEFNDYYDVFIWDFVPGQSSMETYNIMITELRNAWRITHPREGYAHMEPLLRTLTRDDETMRTRQLKPGENVQTLWEKLMDERNQFILYTINGNNLSSRNSTELGGSPYMFYNEANAVEDAVLFPDEMDSNKETVSFREIRNGVNRLEKGLLPSTARLFAKGLQAMQWIEDNGDLGDETENWRWDLPTLWDSAIEQARREEPAGEKRMLLKRTGLDAKHKFSSFEERFEEGDRMETMERDRAFQFKESFHQGDLEPGSTKKFLEIQNIINTMLGHDHSGPTDWVWFVAEILDWLKLRADYDDYTPNPAAPWPHSFIMHDMVQAFATMAIFFPDQDVAALVTKFLNSKQYEEVRKSPLFYPEERAMTRPDRRTRTSYRYQKPEFWKDWNAFLKSIKTYYADEFPIKWSIALRPIVAHLYRAGVIAPAHYQNDPQIVAGMATANTEPHRPEKLDLFISYEDQFKNFEPKFPPSFTTPDKFPVLLPQAKKFGEAHPNARFALLRLWSAAHFYPLMVGPENRRGLSFLDSVGRSWMWKFVPKDMPDSEFSIHHVARTRLGLLQAQFGTRAVNRGDLILVMGEDSRDLLRISTAVTFAIQTKPWLREVDLWKSFINVDLKFLQELDGFWWD